MAQIKKVLIANRGEIAVRIIRACREFGSQSVAVYSDIDRMAPHVRMANEAYRIGPAPAVESYLQIGRLIDAAKKSGCDAVHPGYGFLAENEDAAAEFESAGIIWVGPPAAAIRLMGDKHGPQRRRRGFRWFRASAKPTACPTRSSSLRRQRWAFLCSLKLRLEEEAKACAWSPH